MARDPIRSTTAAREAAERIHGIGNAALAPAKPRFVALRHPPADVSR